LWRALCKQLDAVSLPTLQKIGTQFDQVAVGSHIQGVLLQDIYYTSPQINDERAIVIKR
jgi:hypothetical protein